MMSFGSDLPTDSELALYFEIKEMFKAADEREKITFLEFLKSINASEIYHDIEGVITIPYDVVDSFDFDDCMLKLDFDGSVIEIQNLAEQMFRRGEEIDALREATETEEGSDDTSDPESGKRYVTKKSLFDKMYHAPFKAIRPNARTWLRKKGGCRP